MLRFMAQRKSGPIQPTPRATSRPGDKKRSSGEDATTSPENAPEVLEDRRFEVFLNAYARHPNKGEALRLAHISPEELSKRRNDDSDFARKYLEADELGNDVLEDAAVERAVKGWDEPIFDMRRGIQVGEVRKFSDSLLMFLLKGRRKKFRGEDGTAGRGVSEEARRDLQAMFDEVHRNLPREVPPGLDPAKEISLSPTRAPTTQAARARS